MAFQSFLSVILAMTLAATRGAPLMSSDAILNVLSPKATKDNVAGLSKVSSDERLPWERPARGFQERPLVLTISEETATKLKQGMNKVNEELIESIKTKGSKCGSATITKIDQGERDIPSYFYDVKCPDGCPDATTGDPVFREVALMTVYLKNMDSDKYEVKFRRQIVGCCLEDNADVPELVTHAVQPTTPWSRR